MVSKKFHNPFVQTKSNLFRLGPECFRENDGIKHIFLELTRCSEKYFPLLDEILKLEGKRAKDLLEDGPHSPHTQFHADMIRRARQNILTVKDHFISYQDATMIKSEKTEDLKNGIIELTSAIRRPGPI